MLRTRIALKASSRKNSNQNAIGLNLRGMAKLLLCFRLLVNMVAQEFWRPPALRLSQTTVYPHIVHLMFSFKNSFRHFKNICSPWPLPLRPSTLQARSATIHNYTPYSKANSLPSTCHELTTSSTFHGRGYSCIVRLRT
jgi:hypothetical protein